MPTSFGLGFGAQWGGYPAAVGPGPYQPGGVTAPFAAYRADLGRTMNGSTVAAWADQTPNGHNLTQAYGANQPAYVASGPNSKPCLNFNGSQYMQSDSFGLSGPVSVFIVVNTTNTVTGDQFFYDGAGGLNTMQMEAANATVAVLYSGGASNVQPTCGDFKTLRAYLGVYNGPSPSSSMRYDSVSGDVLGGTNAIGLTSGVIVGSGGGGSYKLAGNICEFIIYNRALSLSERNALSSYAVTRYGVA